MRLENEYIDRMELYLDGQLSEAERVELEKEIAENPLLSERFEEHSGFYTAMKVYRERTLLKNRLSSFHTEMEVENSKQSPKIIRLWKKHYPNMLVAASVAAITVLCMLLTSDFWIGWQKPKAVYRELRRDMEKIQKAQQAIIKDIKSKDTTPVKDYNPGKYGGTGFAISSNGYVVTSYHLIRDAESLTIENKKGQSYTVKPFFTDPDHDLAILKVSDSSFKSFGTIPFLVKSKEADLGERIFTLGYPREDIVFGEGSVSSKSGYEGDTISYQVSVPVNPGNSGGPVFDENGNLVAVISGKQLNTDGAAFAIKAGYLLDAIGSIPKDSLKIPLRLARANTMPKGRSRQLKTIENLVFVVKVYN